MSQRDYNSIGKYDKHGNLISYIEYDDDISGNNIILEKVSRYYNVNGNVLKRVLTSRSDEEPFFEQEKSVIEYEKDIMLFSLITDGETYMCPIFSGQSFTNIKSPGIINSIYITHTTESEALIENFALNSNLIYNYLNKL